MIKTILKYLLFNLLIFFAMLLLANVVALSQNNLSKPNFNKIEISGDTLIRFFLSSDAKYNVSLDSSKRKITVTLFNTFLNNSVNNIQEKGIFQQIHSITKHNDVIVEIQLNEKRGYTSFQTPISHQILINIVDWKNISKAEDLFNTALLAYEDTLNDVASKYLNNSMILGDAKAALIQSLVNFKLGKINRAVKFSEFGEYSANYSPDILILRANYFKSKNDTFHFNNLAEKYKSLTGESLPIITLPTSNNNSDTLSYLEILTIDSLSSTVANHTDTSRNAEMKRFDKIFAHSDTINTNNKSTNTDFWSSLSLLTKAIIISAVVFILLLFVFYLRWRNLQVKANISKARQKAIEESRKKQIAKPKYPSNVVNKFSKTNESAPSTEPSTKTAPEQTHFVEEKVRKVEEIIASIKSQKKLSENEDLNLPQQSQQSQAIPAKIEIARSIYEEQKRIKEEKIKNINNEIINKTDKLKSIAKKIGIEENSLEMKKSIAELTKDKNSIESLSSKFIKH